MIKTKEHTDCRCMTAQQWCCSVIVESFSDKHMTRFEGLDSL